MDKNTKLQLIRERLKESSVTLTKIAQDMGYTEKIFKISSLIEQALRLKKKVLICGNGGSAADAQHFAAELVGGLTNHKRPPLDVLALTTNTSSLTAIGNDYSFDDVFSRQIEAHAREGDVVVAISTSGNSKNVLKAVETAKRLGATTVGLAGGSGGKLISLVDVALCASSFDTQKIQEVHIASIHTICEVVEKELFPSNQKH